MPAERAHTGETGAQQLIVATGVARTRLGWSRQELDRHRVQRLRATLAEARSRSPFYAQRLRGVDIDAFTLPDLARLPPTTKDDLISEFDRIVAGAGVDRARCEAFLAALTAPATLDGLRVFASSGSSGRRALALCSEQDCVANHGMALALLGGQQRAARGDSDGVSVAIGGASPTHLSATTASFMQMLDPRRVVVPIPAATPFEALLARVAALRPAALNGFSSILTRLARAQLRGSCQIAPEVVVNAGEPLTDDDRALLARAFGCPIHDAYGCAELGWLALSTGAGGPMLHFDDQFVIEPIDAAGGPLGHGVASSSVLFTTLERSAAPLIRYQLNDRIRTSAAPDEGPLHFTRIESVLGRDDDWFSYGDVEVHPATFRGVLSARAEIDEYQVRQTPRGAHVLVVASDPSAELAGLADALQVALVQHGVPQPEVSIERLSRLERSAHGSKLQAFVKSHA